DSGLVSFDDLDANDLVDITFASNGDIAWSGGALTEQQKSALVAGFAIPATSGAAAPGSVAWQYSVDSIDLDFLAAGETITFSSAIAATDSHGATAPDVVALTIAGSNDAPLVSAEASAPINELPVATRRPSQRDSGLVNFDNLDANDL